VSSAIVRSACRKPGSGGMNPELYRVRPLDLLSAEADFGALLQQHAEDATVPAAAAR